MDSGNRDTPGDGRRPRGEDPSDWDAPLDEYGGDAWTPEDEEALLGDEDAEEVDEPAILTCPMCGHPNMEFRNHCGQCRQPLGQSNVLPWTRAVDFTATDNPHGSAHTQTPPRVLSLFVVMLLMFALPIIAVIGEVSQGMLLIFVVAILGTMYWLGERKMARERARQSEEEDRFRPEGEEEEEAAEDEAAEEKWADKQCGECGMGLRDIDDLCPNCGRVTAFD